jgi:hypothetical protein
MNRQGAKSAKKEPERKRERKHQIVENGWFLAFSFFFLSFFSWRSWRLGGSFG